MLQRTARAPPHRGAAFAASTSRGYRMDDDTEDTGYQIILPPLPKGRVAQNTVFLHGDVKGRPYRVEDFRDALGPTGLLPEVVALGAYQINHVWAVTMCNEDSTKRMLEVKELKVKGRRCIIVDPQDQQVRLRLHWLLHGVADEDVSTALAAFGKVVQASPNVSGGMSAPAGGDRATEHKGGEPVVVAPEPVAQTGEGNSNIQQEVPEPMEASQHQKQWKRAATLEHRAKRPTKSRQKEAKCPGERRMRGLLQKRLRSGATASDRVPTFTRKRTGHHHTPAVLARLEVPVHLVVPRTSRCVLDAEGLAAKRKQSQVHRLLVDHDIDVLAVQATKVDGDEETRGMVLRNLKRTMKSVITAHLFALELRRWPLGRRPPKGR
ncbi:hypothetical protein HPB50_014386 [Hyalomma asiaticum]|uniref:Uncharacterized protein n=1 Tax=Hyalomma asiaticum TaxID=266040 RepID=A0ACB7SH37_HYAAI|nr:hypothetical protein HPB50_014386 [Hyalomma asiaticum]